MRCETTANPQVFWDRTSEFLLRDPVRNHVLVTVVSGRLGRALGDDPPATYVTAMDDDGTVVGAAMRTPPFNVYLSPMPRAAAAPVVDAMLASCADAGGVTGTADEAQAFADAWARRTGAGIAVKMHQRIYRLDAVTPPDVASGRWRSAGAGDRDLLVRWAEAFEIEADSEAPRTAARDLDARLADGRAFVWEDGALVSFAGRTIRVAGVVRIGPVYTPPEHRRRGYATALVAAVSQDALDGGAVACSLYTDLANHTSNKIYTAIGYRPVCEVTTYRFTSRADVVGGPLPSRSRARHHAT
jgi:predicted GNAT family acetyltransferase